MKNDRIILIMVIAAVLLGGLFWLFGRSAPSKFDWKHHLRLDKDQPFDLSLYYRTLRKEYPGGFDEIPGNSGLADFYTRLNPQMGDIYVYTGENCYLTREECYRLSEFISNGGTAFISASSLPENLFNMFTALKNVYVKSYYADSFVPRFTHPLLRKDSAVFRNYVRNEPREGVWFVLKDGLNGADDADSLYTADADATQSLVLVSAVPGMGADMIILHHNQGKLILHTNPLLFANYYLTRPEGRRYLEKVMNHIPEGRMIFDLSAAMPKQDAPINRPRSNMLDFVRSQPSLWYAWWLLLGSVALFLAFAGRRKQRSIPVIQPPVNHTMAFVDAIGRFYHSEKQNALVFRREWNQLLIFIRQHFRMTGIGNSDEEVRKLSERSGVTEETIRHIAATYEKYRIFSELKAEELMEVNRAIGHFYQEYQDPYGKSTSGKRTAQPA